MSISIRFLGFLLIQLLFIYLSFCVGSVSDTDVVNGLNSDKKIAFLYMTRGHMPLEEIWHEFFRWRANASHYSIYVHPHQGYLFPAGSIFHGKEVHNPLNVKWGGMTQVKGIRLLVQEALLDPLNEWFCLMSESCIPIITFPKWRNALLSQNKSVINACPMNTGEMELDSRWRSPLDSVGMKREYWRKSATWFALNRKHAEIFATEVQMDSAWESVPCCDEHFLPSLLAKHHVDNETTCTDGFVHVVWPSIFASHPRTYSGDEINSQLFASLHRAVGDHPGFNMQCSGIKDVCHFTARKFSSTAKYQLLENIDLILSEDDYPYTGNPWDHHTDKLRHSSNYSQFYVIENDVIREIPDNITAYYMNVNLDKATLLTDLDMQDYKFGSPIPSRRDGMLIKSAKQRLVYYMKEGHRHGIPNIDTFFKLGFNLEDIKVLSDSDLEQITIGDFVQNINYVNGSTTAPHS